MILDSLWKKLLHLFIIKVNKISNGMITQFIISEIDYLKNVQKYIERRPIFIGMKILLLDSISQVYKLIIIIIDAS
jgi:hypothetical protein